MTSCLGSTGRGHLRSDCLGRGGKTQLGRSCAVGGCAGAPPAAATASQSQQPSVSGGGTAGGGGDFGTAAGPGALLGRGKRGAPAADDLAVSGARAGRPLLPLTLTSDRVKRIRRGAWADGAAWLRASGRVVVPVPAGPRRVAHGLPALGQTFPSSALQSSAAAAAAGGGCGGAMQHGAGVGGAAPVVVTSSGRVVKRPRHTARHDDDGSVAMHHDAVAVSLLAWGWAVGGWGRKSAKEQKSARLSLAARRWRPRAPRAAMQRAPSARRAWAAAAGPARADVTRLSRTTR